MSVYWHDAHLTLYGGDCRTVLAELPDQSVHTVVTSPPYWGLRDYGTATWEGGDPACDHLGPPRMSDKSGLSHPELKPRAQILAEPSRLVPQPYRATCGKCGAVRIDDQIGLEPTPEAFVATMVAVFREVRRVLRDDGTLWLNLGDSYAAQRGGTTMPAETLAGGQGGWMADGSRVNRDRHDGYSPSRNASAIGLKHKDLVGIPWRVAFALQADGWYLRSDIIWAKPNPMPESVTDRPTKAHEYVFLLSKSARYFYDADAVREADAGLPSGNGFSGRQGGARQTAVDGGNGTAERFVPGSGRNLRSVWTIATEPYPGAHFATFPRKLVEPCIKAGTSERGVCAECGAPWVREVARTFDTEARDRILARGNVKHDASRKDAENHNMSGQELARLTTRRDVGWRASCDHDAGVVPASVLDPFAGSGTTLLVAQSLGRRGVGIDLNPEYLRQALERNAQTPLGLEVPA